MAVITDEFMREMRAKARLYSLVLLKRASKYDGPEAGAVIWEHGRGNLSLQADGVLAVMCPVADNTEWSGIGVFDKPLEETAQVMNGDSAVQASVLNNEVHSLLGFPDDSLPPGQGGGR